MTSPIHGYLSAVVTKAKTNETKQLATLKHNLLTDNGRDVFFSNVYTNKTTGTHGFNYIASTESTITPAAANTTLTGEITDRGLGRVEATTASHSAGTNTSTVEHTFTVSGAGFTSVLASATFNATSGVTMGHIANFGTGSGTLAANDTLKITWTFNMSSS